MSARKAAMEFMSATVQGLPESKLDADEADFLTTFYVDRLKGEGGRISISSLQKLKYSKLC